MLPTALLFLLATLFIKSHPATAPEILPPYGTPSFDPNPPTLAYPYSPNTTNPHHPLYKRLFPTLPPVHKRDNPWSVFLCLNPEFKSPCYYLRGKQGECYTVSREFRGNITSFGPDRNQSCRMYDKEDCAMETPEEVGFDFIDTGYPGMGRLREVGWARSFVSWRCVALGTESVP
ncbi:hypothetical protein EJ08DRAFT_739112 [Tothia fuscella]|uniref:Uncharacterized protein n=1 Tax=Tothia fuscella TaxID=1048955 RepID=A0A9P4NF46_9PEZI|nr:hypothetical protein EJ08DRAFT_739112 [Tothia fuscella]